MHKTLTADETATMRRRADEQEAAGYGVTAQVLRATADAEDAKRSAERAS